MFYGCSNLTSVYFQGNAPTPSNDTNVFIGTQATIYYLAGTTGWGLTFDGRPTKSYVYPTIQQTVPQGTNLTLNFSTTPEWTCYVERKASLTSGSWEIVSTNVASSTQTNMSITLPTCNPQGFYRIVMVP